MAVTNEQVDEVIRYALNQGGPEATANPQRWAELMADGVRRCTDPGTDMAAALVEISEAIEEEAERQCADWAQRVYRAVTELRGADELADPMSVAPRLAELVPSDEHDENSLLTLGAVAIEVGGWLEQFGYAAQAWALGREPAATDE
jgi:hypothetical protein